MGSAIHAAVLASAGVKVRLMISVDMIGYFSPDRAPLRSLASFVPPGTVMPGQTTSLVGKKGDEKLTGNIREYMLKYSTGISVANLNLPPGTQGMDWSDHRNYWNHGWPAVMLTNYFVCPSPYYHKPTDTIDALDFDKIAGIVKGLYGYLVFCKEY